METREVEIKLKLRINSKLDIAELEYIRSRIEKAIKEHEKPCGFKVLDLEEIKFKPFKFKVGLLTVECTGDKTKTEEKYLK